MDTSPELLTALRTEIVQAQQIGADYLKWKLIGAATVASLALGLSVPTSTAGTDATLLVCLIPLICAYVDMARLDLVIRIVVISRFLQINGDRYETFVDELRHSTQKPFRFAPIAVHLSSIIMSVLVIGMVMLSPVNERTMTHTCALIGSGGFGVAATILLWLQHNSKIRIISKYVPKQQAARATA